MGTWKIQSNFYNFFNKKISCKKNSNNKVDVKKPETVKLFFNNRDPKYLLNPPKSDTLCRNDVERAKKDINKYHKLYIKTIFSFFKPWRL